MSSTPSPLAGKSAVIVEDEGLTQLLLRKCLTGAGMKVVGCAANGQAGVDLVLDVRPDLVLMDINMPGEIDGLEAAQTILSLYRVCIVMVTAYSEAENRRRAAEVSTCGYLVKPVTDATLIPALERAYVGWAAAND
jgi:two-component system, response regulator PdtaR